MDQARGGLLQSRKVARAQDASLARTLATYLHYDRTLAFDQALEERIGALTPEEVAAALRRHVDPNKWVTVEAGDFAGKGPRTETR